MGYITKAAIKRIALAIWVMVFLTGCQTAHKENHVNPYEGKGWYQEMEQIAINYRKDLHMEPGEKTDREVDRFLQALESTGSGTLTQPTTPDELNNIIDKSEEVGLFKQLAIQLDGVTLSKQTGPLAVEEQEEERTEANEGISPDTGKVSVIFLRGLSMEEILLTEPKIILGGLQELSLTTDRVLVYIVQDVAGFIPIYVVHNGHIFYNVFERLSESHPA